MGSPLMLRLLRPRRRRDRPATHSSLTNKALEAVEAAKDLARQRRHALLEPHHAATTLFSDPNTFASRVLKSAGGDAALLHAELRKELRRLPRGDNDNVPQSAILEDTYKRILQGGLR